MAVKYGKFEKPSKITVDESTATSTYARFIAEPFERGFAHTVGNALRRIMLSSLESPAIVSFRIEGVPHEYMAIDGVVEDMTDIVLNVKGALLRKLNLESQNNAREVRIVTSLIDVTQEMLDESKGSYSVRLKHIMTDSYYEMINPELHLFSVTKPFKRQIDIKVAMGRGYVPSERHVLSSVAPEEIVIDTAFSPIHLVNYFVENTRVGQDTDFDKLIIEITTDARVSPAEALSFASQIAIKHFDPFKGVKAQSLAFVEGDDMGDSDHNEIMDKLVLRIDEIELSVRSANCLAGANINTIAELVSIPERRMLEFRNFGKKSLNEIKAKLMEMGLSLGMDLTRFGITPDNMDERVREYQEIKRGRQELIKTEEIG